MLKQRVITALLLMAVLLPSLWVQALWPFSLLSLVFISAAAWEWSRLNDAPGWKAWMMAFAVAGVSLGLADRFGLPLWGEPAVGSAPVSVLPESLWLGAAVLWVVGSTWALGWGSLHWRRLPASFRAVLGLTLLVLAWLALTQAKQQGLNFLLSALTLVWAADIGAYFGGRRFGRRKLAPTISPGKSWEGAAAGLLATCVLSILWVWADGQGWSASPSVQTRLLHSAGPGGLLLGVCALTAMSVVGDLFESLVKRQAGAKDSSQLLPGHGGVLDRIDALLPVLPLTWAVLALGHA